MCRHLETCFIIHSFLIFFVKILDNLRFFPKKSKNFLGFRSTVLKFLHNFARLVKNKCQNLGTKSRKSKKFLANKIKVPSTEKQKIEILKESVSVFIPSKMSWRLSRRESSKRKTGEISSRDYAIVGGYGFKNMIFDLQFCVRRAQISTISNHTNQSEML